MTPEARAESIMICSCPPASKEPKIHIFSCLGSQRKSVTDQIRKAEEAARLETLKECWHLANNDWDTKIVALNIHALMDNPNVS